MKSSKDTRTGWFVSLGLHTVLLLLFLGISLPEAIQNQEFIEVIWGSPAVSTPEEPKPVSETRAESPAKEVQVPKPAARTSTSTPPVILPERRFIDQSDERLPVARTEKIDLAERSGTEQRVMSGVGEREAKPDRILGERDRKGFETGPPGSSIGSEIGSGGLAGDVDRGVSFSIQWSEGGTRRKISGELPQYPPGVNVVAQIKILTVVAPDGAVKSVQPAQKANTSLEDAAMKQVRLWKFEPLRPSRPQEDQSCVVTFLFTLR